MKFHPLLAGLALLLGACTQPQAAVVSTPAVEQVREPDWAFEESDLPVEPEFRFGKLANGMRYVIRPNGTPAGQGMVWLWVHGGSTSEALDERGYAHFIEHMAFNGSTRVPEGEMVKLLEREGLAFGADTNASTGFDQTIYKLNLPRNDEALLGTALMLMREVVSELTFSPEAVEREKGVVLSERRVGDTFAMRNTEDSLSFQFPEALFPQRLPIGTTETLQAATPEKLRGLWQRLYRPENVALMVVGEFDPGVAEAAIRERFADWQAPPALPQPEVGPIDFYRQGETDIYLDPALSERVTVSNNGAWIDEPDTMANRRTNLLRQLGYGIVNRRLQRLTRLENPPFRGAGLGSSDVFESGRTTNLIVDTGDGEWKTGLLAAQAEFRKAWAFGFTPAEVAEQVASVRTGAENAAAGAATRSNSALVNAVLALLNEGQVPTSPQSSLERFRLLEPLLTPEAVLAAFKEELLPLDNPLIRFQGRTAPKGGAQALRAAWDEGMAAELLRDEEVSLNAFSYGDFGPAGKVVADTVEPVMGIRTLRFANGVMLNLKPTELERDRIQVTLNVDGGQLLNTRENPLATSMTQVLPLGGLGKHSIDELQTILAGRSVAFSIADDEASFRMAGTTTPRDLELQLQLYAAALSDPGFRPQGEAQYRRNIEASFAQMNATPNNALANALGRILSDGDPRFTLQAKADYLALNFAGLRAAIGDRLAHGAVELAIVGDFDPEQVIPLVARTMGAIPARESEFGAYTESRRRAFTADRSAQVVRHDGAPDQALIRITWPTRDDSDFDEVLKLELLEQVLQLRLTDIMREELGQTYSPGVSATQSRTYPGYGTLVLVAAVDASQIEAARAAMLSAVEGLLAQPIDNDMLLRARRPMLESFDNALKSNAGWMNLADDAQSAPDRLARFASSKARLAAITGDQIQQTARRYLVPGTQVEILALPREAN